MQHSMPLTASLCADGESGLACVASSVGFSSSSKHLSLFGGAKLGASATLMKKKGIMLQTIQRKGLLRRLSQP